MDKCCENIALPIVRWAEMMCASHHERYDGSGYPEGRKGHDIPLPAAVCGIVDAYAALRSIRSWRRAYDADQAKECRGKTGSTCHGVSFEKTAEAGRGCYKIYTEEMK